MIYGHLILLCPACNWCISCLMEAHTEGNNSARNGSSDRAATTGEEQDGSIGDGCVEDADRGLSQRQGVPVWRLVLPGIPQTSLLRHPVGIQEVNST